MKLSQLTAPIACRILRGEPEIEIADLAYDSRRVTPGALFCCLPGTAVDGHDYIAAAVEKGAVAVLVSREVPLLPGVTYIYTEDTRQALALMSCEYFGHPSCELDVIGITGTKGKTTTSYMIKKLLERGGHKVGLIGTIQTIIGDTAEKAKNTTPESYELQKLFRRMADAGCDKAVVEVSSQGLKMHRATGTRFPLGIYTNLCHDHIGPDEHADMAEYIACKSLFFRMCNTALVNTDDAGWRDVLAGHSCKIIPYGMGENTDITGAALQNTVRDSRLCVDFTLTAEGKTYPMSVGFPGAFSVYNALAAAGAASFFGMRYEDMETALIDVRVPGRTQPAATGLPFTVLIDYAHNEISMENLLSSLKAYHPNRLLCLFGCGGNRDPARRYDMGEKAGRYADLTILTEDNPRYEDPLDIIDDISIGLRRAEGAFEVVPDRKNAIFYMLDMAQPGDICVLIGKGPENYQ